MVHEWAPNLNISIKNLNFHIARISIMMHYQCFQTLHYVFVTRVHFQQTVNDVHI
jgi:hypothetical protein